MPGSRSLLGVGMPGQRSLLGDWWGYTFMYIPRNHPKMIIFSLLFYCSFSLMSLSLSDFNYFSRNLLYISVHYICPCLSLLFNLLDHFLYSYTCFCNSCSSVNSAFFYIFNSSDFSFLYTQYTSKPFQKS